MTRVVVTQALFAVVVLTAINAMHHRGLVTIGEVIATGMGGILAALLFARDR